MTITELLKELRLLLNDFGQYHRDTDTWLTDDTNCLWSNAELVRYLTLAEREYCVRRPIIDSTTDEICFVPMLAAQAEYDLDPRILHVERIRISGQRWPLYKREVDELELSDPAWLDKTEAVPQGYLLDQNSRKLRLYGTPLVSGTLLLRVGRLPLEDLDLADDCFSPEIVEQDHHVLPYYAAYRAYLKDDIESRDDNRAADMLSLFNNEVGPKVDAFQRRVRSQQYDRPMRGRTYY